MVIREARETDRSAIIDIYTRSQAVTGLPDPLVIPPSELGQHLYSRDAINRFVAIEAGKIVGHGLIEHANPAHVPTWWRGMPPGENRSMLEIGGAFVEPSLSGRGIWTQLLRHRLALVTTSGNIPVSATWSQNQHVQKRFLACGGVFVGENDTPAGTVALYVFGGHSVY